MRFRETFRRQWLRVAATALLVGGCAGDDVLADDDDGETDAVGEAVRLSGSFLIDIPADDAWSSSLRDQDSARPGLQVRVEVHRYFSLGRRWADLGNAPWEYYRVITTGEEARSGIPRTVASARSGVLHGLNGAFVRDGRLHLIGTSTGGSNRGGVRRNPKNVVAGIHFNGHPRVDRILPVADIVPVDDPVEGRILVDVPTGEGFPLERDQDRGRPGFQAYAWIDQVSFAQRWTTGEAFACYNFVTTGAERHDGRSTMLGGSTPDQFRAPEGAFGLGGVAFVLGERTGGNSGGAASAPARALLRVAFDGLANGNNPVDASLTVTNLR